jgi:RNA polymerase sigma-70 factor (ECF subfamily)
MHEFDEVYNEYHDDIFRFLFRLTLYNADLAEELTQETFYQAYLAIDRFEGRCHIKTWLCQIAKNTCYQYLRKNLRDVAIPQEPPFQNVEAEYERGRMVRRTLDIIERLSGPSRDVVIYRLFFDMPYTQISNLLGISESSARAIFFRSRKEIQEKIQEENRNEI